MTANKALVAAHGPQLATLAAARGAAFRYEASALSAVPFLGTLADRPLVSKVDRVLAVVNGTSNFILTAIEEQGLAFDAAVTEAQRLGYAEPNPSRDLDGLDAADKLTLLASLFGWGQWSRAALDYFRIPPHWFTSPVKAGTRLGKVRGIPALAARWHSDAPIFQGPDACPTPCPRAPMS